MTSFLRELEEQRWDDHRYYHHSRINQSLHLVSAISFLVTYLLLFSAPVAAALVGWLVAMVTRQVGHFFFEPKGYDEANQATHEEKEAVKVGYNLERKAVLLAIWALSPVAVWLARWAGGTGPVDGPAFLHDVSTVWIALGIGAVVFRMLQLFASKGVQTGVVWVTKILTDPFHDIKLYHRSPLHLLRGELLEPRAVPR